MVADDAEDILYPRSTWDAEMARHVAEAHALLAAEGKRIVAGLQTMIDEDADTIPTIETLFGTPPIWPDDDTHDSRDTSAETDTMTPPIK